MNILIVEDEITTLLKLENIIKKNFSNETINIKTTTLGISAFEIAREIFIDIFIIDIDLPDINGIKLAKNLREFYKLQPIIIESSKNDNEYKARVHNKIHNIAYLTKPYSAEDFISQLDTAIILSKQINTNFLKLTHNSMSSVYNLDEIIYIEKLKHEKKIQVHYYRDGPGPKTDIFSMSLSNLKSLLPNSNHLCQIHRSFLINPSYILRIDHLDNLVFLKYCSKPIPIGTSFIQVIKYIH